MKVFIPLLCLASLAFAEPPVGDGYPGARLSHNDHHDHGHDDHHDQGHNDLHDHQNTDHLRSLSQEYGPPSSTSARNAFNGYDYDGPNGRSSPNARGQSRFPPATVRVSFNQRFSSAAARNANNAARSHAQEHSTPDARSGISQEYGPPAAKSLSQEYGAPSVVSARTLSAEYGVPNARSSPSEEYGAPVAARSNQKPSSSVFRGAPAKAQPQDYAASRSFTDAESHGYTDLSARSNEISQDNDAPKSVYSSRNAPSSTYGAPSQLQSTYNAPSTRNSNAQGYESVSQTYGAPNQRDLSDTYGAPNARSLSQEYGVPSSRTSQKTEASASSYPSASSRSSPSTSYLPARNAMPSQQYGVPEQESQGYENSRARALNELLNQEPASYDFGYQIEDQESGSDFGHTETREENRAEGSYFVVLPDGTKQTVEYEADEGGFRPRISVEPADASARAGGYDDNAQDLARSAGGPY